MTSPSARAVALLSTLALAGAAPASGAEIACLDAGDEDGIGATAFGGGDDDRGIGGTGVYGAITDLGSLCVNGLHIEFDDDVAVTRDGAPASTAALAVGRVVWVEATRRDGGLHATSIALDSALRGHVDTVSLGARRFTVSGVEVEVPVEAVAPGSPDGALAVSVGDAVEVSGLWRDAHRLVATRIERVDAAPTRVERPADLLQRARGKHWLSIEGHVSPGARPGSVVVQGVPIDAPATRVPEVGARVWVRGRLGEDGRLVVDRIVRRPERSPPAEPLASGLRRIRG